MKRGRKPKPEVSPELAACDRLTDDGASSNATIRKRIALIAAERKLDPSETMAMMKGRWLRTFDLRQFAKKHHLSVDWLIFGDLKGSLETVKGCPSRPEPRPRVLSNEEFGDAIARLDHDGRQFIIDYMNLLLAKRSS
jgi:hypothetical protein